MFYFSLQNLIAISILSAFLSIAIICFFVIKHEYIHEKVKGWIYIILFLYLFFIHSYITILALAFLSILAIKEFYKVLVFSKLKNTLFLSGFIILLFFFDIFIFYSPVLFLYLFITISLSDIIAYFIGKSFPWKKGFTSLSPNKTLSGLIAQVLFIVVFINLLFSVLFFEYKIGFYNFFFYTILFGILAPIGDLSESYFKRKAGVKDMADYIPGHGGVLDRIDSIFLSSAIISLYILYNL